LRHKELIILRFAGHCEVAECLLEAGASCSDFTFDGERCYYVALTQAIKQLLLAHAQRSRSQFALLSILSA